MVSSNSTPDQRGVSPLTLNKGNNSPVHVSPEIGAQIPFSLIYFHFTLVHTT